jgi:hypothetical protein
MTIKLRIARAQLGTALSLFIRDKDALSVQALACGGAEIMEGLTEQAELPTLSTHILSTMPNLNRGKLVRLRNQYWSAIKHFYARDNRTMRDDEELMSGFTDAANDAVLFDGWLNYLTLTKRLPVEVQVFQVWWYALYEGSMSPEADPTPWRQTFPDIASDPRCEQKRRLRRAIASFSPCSSSPIRASTPCAG